MTTLMKNNPPEKLLPLAERWQNSGKSFYLGPENIFTYNNNPLNYKGAEDISRDYGSWYICTDDCVVPPRTQLSKGEVEDIAKEFAKYMQLNVASLAIGYVCNAKCIMCPYHGVDNSFCDNEIQKQKIKVVDKDIIFKRIDKIKEMGIKTLYLVSSGETISNPYWYDYMKYAQDLGFNQWLITNGIGINDNIIEKLKTLTSVSAVQISLHAKTFETWAKISRINSEEAYKNAIEAPLKLKKIGKSPISVTFVNQEENKHELKDFIDYWYGKVDNIRIIQKMKIDETLFKNNEFNRIDVPQGLCGGYSGSLIVRTDGIIVPCCAAEYFYTDKNVDEGKIPILNIDNDSIEKIKSEYFNMAFDKEFIRYCCHCYSNTLDGLSEDISIYGYKAKKYGITSNISYEPEEKRLLKVKCGKNIVKLSKIKM